MAESGGLESALMKAKKIIMARKMAEKAKMKRICRSENENRKTMKKLENSMCKKKQAKACAAINAIEVIGGARHRENRRRISAEDNRYHPDGANAIEEIMKKACRLKT